MKPIATFDGSGLNQGVINLHEPGDTCCDECAQGSSCDVCKRSDVPLLEVNGAADEYQGGFICESCVTRAFRPEPQPDPRAELPPGWHWDDEPACGGSTTARSADLYPDIEYSYSSEETQGRSYETWLAESKTAAEKAWALFRERNAEVLAIGAKEALKKAIVATCDRCAAGEEVDAYNKHAPRYSHTACSARAIREQLAANTPAKGGLAEGIAQAKAGAARFRTFDELGLETMSQEELLDEEPECTHGTRITRRCYKCEPYRTATAKLTAGSRLIVTLMHDHGGWLIEAPVVRIAPNFWRWA